MKTDIRIVHNKLLGGWYVVRGPHQTPLNGRFNSKAEAEAYLRKKNPARQFRGWLIEKKPVTGYFSAWKSGHVRLTADTLAGLKKLITEKSRKKNPTKRKKNPRGKQRTHSEEIKVVPFAVHVRRSESENWITSGYFKAFNSAKKSAEYLARIGFYTRVVDRRK